MKKYYIPTSTLNFNNILSSESISPKAFYDKRGFGYSRWATIPENPFDNAIILYDNLCYFERPKSDMEDHPLLVEIQLDESEINQVGNYYYCDHTLYLAPTTTNFIFFSEKDIRITKSMSESSLETKLMRIFAKHIVLQKTKTSDTYILTIDKEPCELNENEILKDIRINKMKGLLYGYYIGGLLSTPNRQSVKLLNSLREIHNIFAAILSSFDKRPTEYQDKRLDYLFETMNERNPVFEGILEIITSSAYNSSEKAKKIWNLFKSKINYSYREEDKNYYLNYLLSSSDKEDANPSISWIKSKIEEEKSKMRTECIKVSPENSEIVVLDGSTTSLKNPIIDDKTETKLCVSWINDTLSDKNTNGKISTYKEELAKNITLKAKEVYDKDWESSTTRVYLNDLRKHIVGDAFNHQWNNSLLSSIAAVIIAGDDWEKMLSFMQSKEMTDYRLAFAFYGELNGFANLTRDFTDIFYNQNSSYVWEVYKEFYGQICGKELKDKPIIATGNQNATIPTKIVSGTKISISIEQNSAKKDTDTSNLSNELGNCNIKSTTQFQPPTEDKDISEIIQKIQNHPKYDRNKHEHYCLEIANKNIKKWDEIKKLSTKRGDGWKTIIDELRKEKTKTSNIVQSVLFTSEDYPIGKHFYCDKNVWWHICTLVKEQKALDDLKDNLNWFQMQFSKPVGQRGYNYDSIDEKNNKLVIEKFCSLRLSKTKYEKYRDIIKHKLLELYDIK